MPFHDITATLTTLFCIMTSLQERIILEPDQCLDMQEDGLDLRHKELELVTTQSLQSTGLAEERFSR